jgi:K+-sensing histidine kinase KdpD
VLLIHCPLDRHGFVEECYFIFSYSPIRQENGEVGGVLVTVTETTERVLGARRLKTLQALAAKMQEAPTAEAACEAAAEALAANPADLPFARIYLLSADGRRATLAASAHLSERAGAGRYEDLVQAAAETGAAQLLEQPMEDGLPQRVLALPIAHSGAGRPTGVLVAAISPRLQLDDSYRSFLELAAGQIATAVGRARALAEAKARAEALAEIDRAKTAFFSNVSHELRTPLTLILGPAEDALRQPGPPADTERWRLVHRNALRLLKLVNTLLDFSRLEAGRMQASYEPTDPAPTTTWSNPSRAASCSRASAPSSPR